MTSGYKQTEVGVIPVDWEAKALSRVAPLQRGFDLPTPQLRSGPFPVVYSNGVLNYHVKAMVTGPGVVTGRSGTIGKVNYIESDYWPHNTTLWVTSFKGNAPKFIYYLYQDVGLDRFGTGSGVPTLNRNDVHAFSVPMPPLPEQTAIAEALSDADALIESLEQLITKKRHLKQGVMQELLTGKTRLPGFTGEWKVSTFGDVFNITAGGDVDPKRTILYQDQTHCYPIYSNALTDYGLYGYCSYADHPTGSITVTARGTLGFANFRDHAYTAVGRVLILQPKQESDGRFFAEVINNRIKFAIESTGVPQLTAPQISTYSLPVPPLPEQTAIATILSDMDAEIAALEIKLVKTRSLKQGMMHELLTGRIRLIKGNHKGTAESC